MSRVRHTPLETRHSASARGLARALRIACALWIGLAILSACDREPNSKPAARQPTSAQDPATWTTRQQALQLGIALSDWVLGRARRGDPRTLETPRTTARDLASRLGVALPPPPDVTGNGTADGAAAMAYLLEAGKALGPALDERRGPGHAALLELGVKTTLLELFYVPEDTRSLDSLTGLTLATAQRSAELAGLPEASYAPQLRRVLEGASREDMKAAIRTLHDHAFRALGE